MRSSFSRSWNVLSGIPAAWTAPLLVLRCNIGTVSSRICSSPNDKSEWRMSRSFCSNRVRSLLSPIFSMRPAVYRLVPKFFEASWIILFRSRPLEVFLERNFWTSTASSSDKWRPSQRSQCGVNWTKQNPFFCRRQSFAGRFQERDNIFLIDTGIGQTHTLVQYGNELHFVQWLKRFRLNEQCLVLKLALGKPDVYCENSNLGNVLVSLEVFFIVTYLVPVDSTLYSLTAFGSTTNK